MLRLKRCSLTDTKSLSMLAPKLGSPPCKTLSIREPSRQSGIFQTLSRRENLASQVNEIGQLDAVIHNAGVCSVRECFP